jgi:flagella basal body P-ring formation protein FlgA
MIRIVVALVALLALGRGASADAASPRPLPRLKEVVTVASEIVRIGDLMENAGAAADIAVFRAPDPGQTGTVQVGRIAEALRPHDVTKFDTGGLREVVVTRLSRAITQNEIADRIARAVAGQFGFGKAHDLSVVLDRDVRVLHVEASATADLALGHMNVNPRTGRFDLSFELPGSSAARRLPLRFTGTVAELVEAATLARSLQSGEVVKEADVVMERRRKVEVGHETISAEQAIGLAAKRALRGGQLLRSGDLMRPQLVQRNEAVTIVYEVPGILLTVRGKALEAGAMDEIVGVLNIQSNRTIQAKVSGPGRVTVAAIAPRVATAAAPDPNDPSQRHTQ